MVPVIAIYARQSVDKKDSISIESQIDLCKKECNAELTKIYSDKGFSGKNTNRPKFEQLMKDVKDGLVTKVVVYRLDRFSRSIADFGQAWAKFQENNVEFISINEKFDTSTPMGRAMLHIIMVFAQLERETIAERVKDNYYSRIKCGNWPGGPAPLGFDNAKTNTKDGKKIPTLVPNKDMEIIKRIFFEYSGEAASLGIIARELSQEGISCMRCKSWNNVSLSRILHNPVYVEATADVYKYYKEKGVTFSNPIDLYTGETSAHIVGRRSASDRKYTYLENQVVSLTNFPGTIPAEIWLKCQYKLNNNKQIKNTGRGKLSWLSGYIKCGKCGYSLAIRKYNEQLYLHCSGRTNLHLCDIKGFTLTIGEIENAVKEELENIISECTLDKNQCIPSITENKQKIELEKIEQKIQKLIASLTEASDITMKYINDEIKKLDKKRNELLKKPDSPKTEALNNFKDVIFDQLSFDEKKLVVSQFIEKIMVFEDEIEIIWKV